MKRLLEEFNDEKNLKELEQIIFHFGVKSKAYWLNLDKQVDIAWENATEEEKEAFVDSGAGDMLGQVIEFLE